MYIINIFYLLCWNLPLHNKKKKTVLLAPEFNRIINEAVKWFLLCVLLALTQYISLYKTAIYNPDKNQNSH